MVKVSAAALVSLLFAAAGVYGAAGQGSAAEAEVLLDRHSIRSLYSLKSLQSLYGGAELQFAAYLHAQLSSTATDMAGARTASGGSYQEFSFYMKASATDTMYAMAKMDVEDEDDVLEQIYFAWDDIGGSRLSVSFGEKQVRFGQWAALGYNSGLAYGWPRVAKDPRDPSGQANLLFPGWLTDVVQFEAKVRLHRTTDFYVSSLLNPRTAYGSTATGEARDTGFFQSYSMQLETRPVGGLHAKLSLVNFHDEEPRNRYDGTLLPVPSVDATAWSLGVTWRSKKGRIFAEYVGTNDWDNVEGYDLRLYEVGLWFDVTERFGFGLMYDWANANAQGAGGADAELTGFMAGIGFTFEKDVKAYLEYVHQEERSASEKTDSILLGVHWWF